MDAVKGLFQVYEINAPINVQPLEGGGEAGHWRGISTELRVSVQMPHPRALWIVKIATKSQQNVARNAIKTVKKPHYGKMITVKSPAFARPPPQRLTIDRCINRP